MKIQYSSAPYNELSISGTREEFISLAQIIRAGKGKVACVCTGSPKPYDKFLNAIVIVDAPGKAVTFSVIEDEQVVIEGDKSKMEKLAINVESFGKEAAVDHHSHEEYFDGHFYLSPESFPVVFEFSNTVH